MKPRTSPRLAGSQASRSETRGIRACQIRPQERQLISTFVEKSKITSWEINEFLPCEAGLIKSEFLGAVNDMKPPGRRSWSGVVQSLETGRALLQGDACAQNVIVT